jgi:hypothetical protein
MGNYKTLFIVAAVGLFCFIGLITYIKTRPVELTTDLLFNTETGVWLNRDSTVFNGNLVSHNLGGSLHAKGQMKNGDFDGLYTTYYESGEKKIEMYFKNKAVISWKEFNKAGKIISTKKPYKIEM